MLNLPIKIRKGKKVDTYYCRIWNSQKQNTDTITLGKKTSKFTLTEAAKEYERIKDLYTRGVYNLKAHEEKDIREQDTSKLTLTNVFDLYYANRLKNLKAKFLNSFQDEYNITLETIENNVTFKRKLTKFNSSKNTFYNHLLYKTKNDKNDLFTIAKIPFKSITKYDIEKIIERISNKNLRPKTISNILNEFKAIYNFGIEKFEIEMSNPFTKFKKYQEFKNPKEKRNKVLSKNELILLFTELEKLPNRNAFISALMGFCFSSRSETVLNIRKKDFNVKIDENGFYYYDTVNLKNLKNPKKPYPLPIPMFLGMFLYQYLLDHKLEEYVLRAKKEGQRHEIPKPLNSINRDYYDVATRLFFYDNILNNLYKDLQEVKEGLAFLRKQYVKMYHQADEFELALKKEQIEKLVTLENEIKIKMTSHLKKLKSNQTHKNENYFDFHSLRHQSSSEIAKINYFYCAYCLSHSDKGSEDEIIRRYAKIDLNDLRKVLTKTYSPFLNKLIESTEEIKLYYEQNLSHKEIYETQFNVKNNKDYSSKEALNLLQDIKIAIGNNNIENNPHFEQDRTPYLDEMVEIAEKNIDRKKQYLKEDLEIEKRDRKTEIKPKYKPF